jgi:hypothetical protein
VSAQDTKSKQGRCVGPPFPQDRLVLHCEDLRPARVVESITDFEAVQAVREVVSYTADFLKNVDIPFFEIRA